MKAATLPGNCFGFLCTLFLVTAMLVIPAAAQTATDAPTPIGPEATGSSANAPQKHAYQQNSPYPAAPRDESAAPYDKAPAPGQTDDGTFTSEEILGAGHSFFGRVSTGLARVVEYAFSKSGRPNGYILGEEAGGAIVAGLRYGEGTLHTKDAGQHKVFWQGPSIGYDFGAEGSKTMILVYNLKSAGDVYGRFGGVDGSAYFIGGVGLTIQKRDHITLAPIRSGVGLRLGANVGYLKFTRRPTWNPF